MTQSKRSFETKSLVATDTTEAIDLKGKVLVGIDVPELTSTDFTLLNALSKGGTYKTVKDPLGFAGGTAGAEINFILEAAASGYYAIPPYITAGLEWIKIAFGSAETAEINLITREIE